MVFLTPRKIEPLENPKNPWEKKHQKNHKPASFDQSDTASQLPYWSWSALVLKTWCLSWWRGSRWTCESRCQKKHNPPSITSLKGKFWVWENFNSELKGGQKIDSNSDLFDESTHFKKDHLMTGHEAVSIDKVPMSVCWAKPEAPIRVLSTTSRICGKSVEFPP